MSTPYPHSLQALIDQLVVCVPDLTPEHFSKDIPNPLNDLNVLDWLIDSLEPEGLIEFMDLQYILESAEPHTAVPNFKLLKPIDLSQFDSVFISQFTRNSFSDTEVEQIIEGTFDFSLLEPDYENDFKSDFTGTGPHELPWFNHLNHFLEPFQIRIIDLSFQNPWVLCVHDNPKELIKLQECLNIFNICFDDREPMNRRQTVEFLRKDCH